MILKNQHTSLRSINKNDIEQIRSWRNQESVNHYLATPDLISKSDQEKWFESIDYSNSIYFMIEESSLAYGVVYARNISTGDKSFEGCIFMGHNDNSSMQLPVKASLMLTIFFFDRLHFDHALSKVHYMNKAALDLDRHLGFRQLKQEGDFIISSCGKADFETCAARLKKALLRNQPVEVVLEEEDQKYSFLNNRDGILSGD